MNITALTLRDFEYVVSVGETLHFGKAAVSCHVSQPTLSGQIKKVEALLGIQIFERSNRTVFVTPMGQKVISQAKVILAEAQKIGHLVEAKRPLLSASLRIGAIATLGPYYLPHIIAPLRAKFPQLQLHIKEGLTDGLIADLKADLLDVVIASPTFQEDSLETIALFYEPFLLGAPKGHPLTTQKFLKSTDLRGGEMILLEDGHCLRDQALQICPTNRRGNIRELHVTSVETLRHLVASGQGYTLIPLLAATDDAKLRKVISYRAFDGDPPGREIALFYRNKYPRPEDMRELGRYLRQIRPRGTDPSLKIVEN